MSDKDILSQEEIDALLQNVDEDETDQLEQESSNDSSVDSADEDKVSRNDVIVDNEQIVPIDFFNQERIVRGQLPVLDRVYERMTKKFAEDVYQMMSKEIHIEPKPMKIHKYQEIISSLRIPTMVNLFRLRPLRGKAMILFDSTLVFNLVDNYFGGSSQFNSQIDRLDFTLTEIRIVDIFTQSLIQAIVNAWSSIINLQALKIGSETNPQLVNINEATDLMMVNRFSTQFEKPSGDFMIVMPYSMIEPIKKQLELGMGGSDDDIDPNWTNSLVEELMEVELPINSILAKTELSLSKIQQLKIDDFIPLTQCDPVTLDIDGIPLFQAAVGSVDEKYALQISNKINY